MQAYIGTPDIKAAIDVQRRVDDRIAAGESTEGEYDVVEAGVLAALAGMERVELTEEISDLVVTRTDWGAFYVDDGVDREPGPLQRRWVSGWVPVTKENT